MSEARTTTQQDQPATAAALSQVALDANAAAVREGREETGELELTDVAYVCSQRIDDFRYRKSEHKIMTAFFAATYVSGQACAGAAKQGSIGTSSAHCQRAARGRRGKRTGACCANHAALRGSSRRNTAATAAGRCGCRASGRS